MTFHDSIRKLQEERNELCTRMRTLLTESNGNLEGEKRAEFERIDKEQEDRRRRIEDMKRSDELSSELGNMEDDHRRVSHVRNSKTSNKLTYEERNAALQAMFLGAHSEHLTPIHRRAIEKAGVNCNSNTFRFMRPTLPYAPRTVREARELCKQWVESRATSDALASGTSDRGGDSVANNMMAAIELWTLAYGGMRQVSTVIRTATGGTLPVPVTDDTGNSGALLAENTATTTHTMVFSQRTLSAKKYTSKLVPASIEFLQDTSINAGAILGELIGTRIGRIQNSNFTVGPSTTAGTPMGVVDGGNLANSGSTNSSLTGVTSSTFNTLIYSEVIDLIHSVDPSYRMSPSAYMMFNDTTLGLFKKLVDSQNRPLWLPSMRDQDPDTVFGKPYVINQSMPSFSTATVQVKPIAYGDFSKYWIQDVLSVDIRVLRERYAELGQVAWLAFARADGTVINRAAIKHLKTSTT